MSQDKPSHSELPERIRLRIEFHYEVDELGESYRVWEEQLREPIGIGEETVRFERRLSS